MFERKRCHRFEVLWLHFHSPVAAPFIYLLYYSCGIHIHTFKGKRENVEIKCAVAVAENRRNINGIKSLLLFIYFYDATPKLTAAIAEGIYIHQDMQTVSFSFPFSLGNEMRNGKQ